MKSVLIETISDEEFKMVQDFIKEHKLKGFMVETSKVNGNDVINDVVRVLLPILY